MKDIKNIKISLDFFKRNKRDIYFAIIGIVLIVLLLWVITNNIQFLAQVIDDSLDISIGNYSPTRFNLSGLQSLGILNPQQSSPPAIIGTPLPSNTTSTP